MSLALYFREVCNSFLPGFEISKAIPKVLRVFLQKTYAAYLLGIKYDSSWVEAKVHVKGYKIGGQIQDVWD